MSGRTTERRRTFPNQIYRADDAMVAASHKPAGLRDCIYDLPSRRRDSHPDTRIVERREQLGRMASVEVGDDQPDRLLNDLSSIASLVGRARSGFRRTDRFRS
jgi:hypothetical protein